MRKRENNLRSCYAIEIVTPKRVVLNGLWFGKKKPKRVIIWVHGLGSSLFSKLGIVKLLARGDTAVLTFNNRGHDKISAVHYSKKSRKRAFGGSAHEVFADCVDDIDGAVNFVKRARAGQIYLAGHSTGCQKSIYWASKNPFRTRRVLNGIILLAPISDYSAEMHLEGKGKMARAASAARALIRQGKKHRLLPPELWPEHIDAQRFISLYTPDSTEEIFTYARPKKIPRLFQSVKFPILAIFAGKDEFADRPAKKIAEWFERNSGANLKMLVVPKVPHSFYGSEKKVAVEIRKWIVEH